MAIQTTTFKGARYLVKFHDPIEWASTESYEAIEAVQYNAFTYISKQPVPAGVQIDNTDFWLLWADPNAQMEELRRIVSQYVDSVEELSGVVSGLLDALGQEIENRKIDIEKAHVFETVADMKQNANLSVGAICHTNGFHTSGDGGGTWYEITDTGTANEMDVIACGELFAKLVPDNQLHFAQFGCVENDDIVDAFTLMLGYGKPLTGDGKTYIIGEPVECPTSIEMHDVKINFANTSTGLFVREDDTDYKSPLTQLMESAKFYDCEFFNAVDANNGRSSYSAALPIYAKNVEVIGCTFRDNACNGMMLYGENALAFNHVYISDCIAYDNGVYDTESSTRVKTGMGIGSYQDVNNFGTDITVENCTCWENSNSGIGIHGLNNVKISNCKCYGNHEHGITIQSSINSVISDCVCLNNQVRAIRIQGDWNVTPTYCKDVIVSNCITKGTYAFGIGGGCQDIVIENCNCEIAIRFIDLDPMGKWDSNIIVRNNMITLNAETVLQQRGLFYNLNANEHNIVAYDNIIDGEQRPIAGFTLNAGASTDEPTQIFVTSEPYCYGLVGLEKSFDSSNGLTIVDNEYTATQSGGYAYIDIPIADIRKYAAMLVKGTAETISGSYSGGIRIQIRGDSNTDMSNRIQSQAILKEYEGTDGIWCMVIDKEEVLKLYPTATTIRFRFTLSTVGDKFTIEKTKVFF